MEAAKDSFDEEACKREIAQLRINLSIEKGSAWEHLKYSQEQAHLFGPQGSIRSRQEEKVITARMQEMNARIKELQEILLKETEKKQAQENTKPISMGP